MAYDIGDLVTLTGTFTDAPTNGTVHDPTTVSVTIREPDGTATTYVYGTDAEVTKASTGVYNCDWSIDQSGQHFYRWFATGTGQASEESSFLVKELRSQ